MLLPSRKPGSLGSAPPGADVAVVDPSGTECELARFDSAGRLGNSERAIGELVRRNADGSFEGYWNNPEAESDRLRGGWFWSGDLAYRDADYVFWFAGRVGDWLRVDSENFAASPVERIIGRYEPAAAVAVVGVPDPLAGDQVMAVLELAQERTFDPDEFADFLRAQSDLGTKWAPRFVRVTAGDPRRRPRQGRQAAVAPGRLAVRRRGLVATGRGAGLRHVTADERDRDALREQFSPTTGWGLPASRRRRLTSYRRPHEGRLGAGSLSSSRTRPGADRTSSLITLDRPEAKNAATSSTSISSRKHGSASTATTTPGWRSSPASGGSYMSGADLKTYVPEITALSKEIKDGHRHDGRRLLAVRRHRRGAAGQQDLQADHRGGQRAVRRRRHGDARRSRHPGRQ